MPYSDMQSFVERRANEWIDNPVEIYGGIPLNPSYMDGVNDKDRDGKYLSLKEQATLMYFREHSRNIWLKQRKDNDKR